MPYLPGLLNLGWESISFVRGFPFYGVVLWFSLSLIINCFNIRRLLRRKKEYVLIFLLALFFACILYNFIFNLFRGQLISSFVIDAIMAVSFVLNRKRVSSILQVSIAFTKLIGDFFAWMYYYIYSPFVLFVGFLVLSLNFYYFIYSLKELNKTN